MKNILKLSAVLFLLWNISSCAKDDIPICVQQLITDIRSAPVQNPPVRIEEWRIANTVYYYVTSGCCDRFNHLYDNECNIVCAPDGGITGKGDGNCPTGMTFKKVIWEDGR